MNVLYTLLCTQVESVLSPLLEAYFPPLSGVRVLAQPGSFYVASAFTLAVNVIAKEVVTRCWDGLVPGESNESHGRKVPTRGC